MMNQLNHFEKFNFEISFEIDLEKLEEKYLEFQKKFHPDKLTNKSESEMVDLEHSSVIINEGYEIIKHPLKRAIYILKLNGININDDNCKIKPDQETIIYNLELRERIFDSNNKEELEEIRKNSKNEIRIILKKVEKEFKNNNLENSALELIKAKYLDKSLIEIKEKIRKL